MPHSDPTLRPYVREIVRRLQPATVLDVGPGSGSYGRLVREEAPGAEVCGVEIFAPYVEEFGLLEVYDRVDVADVRGLGTMEHDLVILGDVLEHMTAAEALAVWEVARRDSPAVVASIPTVHWPQGESHGNPHEEHVVDDWTVDKVLAHFPGITEHRVSPLTSVFLAERR